VASDSTDRNGVSRKGICGKGVTHTDGMGKHDLAVRNLDLLGDDGRHVVVVGVVLGESRGVGGGRLGKVRVVRGIRGGGGLGMQGFHGHEGLGLDEEILWNLLRHPGGH